MHSRPVKRLYHFDLYVDCTTIARERVNMFAQHGTVYVEKNHYREHFDFVVKHTPVFLLLVYAQVLGNS